MRSKTSSGTPPLAAVGGRFRLYDRGACPPAVCVLPLFGSRAHHRIRLGRIYDLVTIGADEGYALR